MTEEFEGCESYILEHDGEPGYYLYIDNMLGTLASNHSFYPRARWDYSQKDNCRLYLGDSPLNLLKIIDAAPIGECECVTRGVRILPQISSLDFLVYMKITGSHYYLGKVDYTIDNQRIISINGQMFWLGRVTGLTTEGESNILFSYSDRKLGIRKHYIANIYACTHTGTLDFNMSEGKLFVQICGREPHIEWEHILIRLPTDIDPTTFRIHSLNDSQLSTLASYYSKWKKELYLLAEVLKKYQALGVAIDIQQETDAIMKYPDFIIPCVQFLNTQLLQIPIFNYNRCRYANSKKCFTFHIASTFDKKYYTAAKLAEHAKSTTTNTEGTVYYITFCASDVEYIKLMYYNIATPFNEDKDYMIEISKYLKDVDCLENLFDMLEDCDHIVSTMGKGLCRNYDHLLTHIRKGIKQAKRDQLNAMYEEMRKENRIPSKWKNELKLYSLIKLLVPEAVYQYILIMYFLPPSGISSSV